MFMVKSAPRAAASVASQSVISASRARYRSRRCFFLPERDLNRLPGGVNLKSITVSDYRDLAVQVGAVNFHAGFLQPIERLPGRVAVPVSRPDRDDSRFGGHRLQESGARRVARPVMADLQNLSA